MAAGTDGAHLDENALPPAIYMRTQAASDGDRSPHRFRVVLGARRYAARIGGASQPRAPDSNTAPAQTLPDKPASTSWRRWPRLPRQVRARRRARARAAVVRKPRSEASFVSIALEARVKAPCTRSSAFSRPSSSRRALASSDRRRVTDEALAPRSVDDLHGCALVGDAKTLASAGAGSAAHPRSRGTTYPNGRPGAIGRTRTCGGRRAGARRNPGRARPRTDPEINGVGPYCSI